MDGHEPNLLEAAVAKLPEQCSVDELLKEAAGLAVSRGLSTSRKAARKHLTSWVAYHSRRDEGTAEQHEAPACHETETQGGQREYAALSEGAREAVEVQAPGGGAAHPRVPEAPVAAEEQPLQTKSRRRKRKAAAEDEAVRKTQCPRGSVCGEMGTNSGPAGREAPGSPLTDAPVVTPSVGPTATASGNAQRGNGSQLDQAANDTEGQRGVTTGGAAGQGGLDKEPTGPGEARRKKGSKGKVRSGKGGAGHEGRGGAQIQAGALQQREADRAGVGPGAPSEATPGVAREEDGATPSGVGGTAGAGGSAPGGPVPRAQGALEEGGGADGAGNGPGEPGAGVRRVRNGHGGSDAKEERGGAAAGTAAVAPAVARASGGTSAHRVITDERGLATWRADQRRSDVKSGPFTREEDARLLDAARAYALAEGLPGDNLAWVRASAGLKPSIHRNRKAGVLKEVATALPHRTYSSVWSRLFRLTHPGNGKGAWTAAEDEALRAAVARHGHKWTPVGEAVERLPEACRDRWRALGAPGGEPAAAPDGGGGGGDDGDRTTGRWTEGEEARLRAAVEGVRSEVPEAGEAEQPRRNRSHVRDGVDWAAVAAAVPGRTGKQCMQKWYRQLRPNMTETGEWGRGDDKTLLAALWQARPAFEFEVEWHQVVPGRSGNACHRRWHLMRGMIPDGRNLELPQQIRYLVALKRPGLLSTCAETGPYAIDAAAIEAVKAAHNGNDKEVVERAALSLVGL